MNEVFKKIENLLIFQRWQYDITETVENPRLFVASCFYIIKEFLLHSFDKEAFAKLVAKDGYTRELFRLAFYYSLILRNKTKKQTTSEKELFENEETRKSLEWWENISDNFTNSTPVFDQETFWNVVLSEEFMDFHYTTTFSEMFAAIVVYALPNDMSLYVLEVLRTILTYCEDGDAKKVCAILQPFYSGEFDYPYCDTNLVAVVGGFFQDKETNLFKICINTKVIGSKLKRTFLVINEDLFEKKVSEELV